MDVSKIGNAVNYDKDSFKNAFDAVKQKIREAIMHYGTLSKRFIIDGNSAPISEEDKDNFNDYLKRNTDSNMGVLSLDEFDTVSTILPFDKYFKNIIKA